MLTAMIESQTNQTCLEQSCGYDGAMIALQMMKHTWDTCVAIMWP